jgi:hypothetical protein
VRARLAGTPEFPSELAAEFFATIQERCSKMAKTLFHCWGQLHYEGLPWRGEFWLDDRLRLGPPSREEGPVPPFNLPMLWGPRVILVDAQVEALDGQDAGSAFREKLRELAIFLSIVTRIEISMPRNNVRTWTCRPDVNGQIECEVRQLGYHEPNLLQEMPAKGTTPPVRLKTVARPDLSLYGLHNRDETEQWLPEDVVHLWRQFTSLPPDRRRQFLQAGNQWRLALAFHQESQTDSFAKMVVACEALKPPGQESDYFNVYDVVEALWGRAFADGLRRDGLRPQELRNAYFHRGEVQGDEIREPVWLSTFEDPSFSRALLAFQPVPPAAILEWLRLGGSLPPMRPKRLDWRRRFAMTPTSLAFVSLGSSVCAALGWLLHAWLAR